MKHPVGDHGSLAVLHLHRSAGGPHISKGDAVDDLVEGNIITFHPGRVDIDVYFLIPVTVLVNIADTVNAFDILFKPVHKREHMRVRYGVSVFRGHGKPDYGKYRRLEIDDADRLDVVGKVRHGRGAYAPEYLVLNGLNIADLILQHDRDPCAVFIGDRRILVDAADLVHLILNGDHGIQLHIRGARARIRDVDDHIPAFNVGHMIPFDIIEGEYADQNDQDDHYIDQQFVFCETSYHFFHIRPSYSLPVRCLYSI